MTAPFTLPSAWREPPVPEGPYREAVVNLAGVRPGIARLAAECAVPGRLVLLAAHVKVLGMLTDEPAFHAEVAGCDGAGPSGTVPSCRRAATWRELVCRVAATVTGRDGDAGPDDDGEHPGYGDRVLFDLGPDGAVGSAAAYGVLVVVGTDALRVRVRTDAVAGRYLTALTGMYRSVLAAMAADPDGDARTAHLAPGERRLILSTWSRGEVVDRGDATVPELIAAQAARTPDAVAVRLAGAVLTYRELDERANRIAHHLACLGARPETLVGVCLRRSPDLLPALLGVWRSGAGYLPLDPALPAGRLAHMVEAAGCRLVVTEAAHAPVPGTAAVDRYVLLDEHRAAIAAHPATSPPVPADPGRLAYVMYTSGSTGAPKGVVVEHGSLANYLLWTVEAYASRGRGGSAFFSSISFDLGMPSLFTPLLTGEPVHLLPDPLPVAELGDQLAAGAPYTFLKMTPGHLDLLSLDLTPQQIHDLAGIVVAAGDCFTRELAERWIGYAGPGGTLVGTEYGPTEITVGNSGCPVTQPPGTDLVPLGRPIPNTTMYLLTDLLEPVPVGVPGEVYVGGAGLARGYLDRPGLTADRFVPDPFGPPGSRLYRTGDRARWRPGGELEFLGRLDNQVKIRGYRIELGEIEARLRGHAHVAEVVVAACDGTGRRPVLAAFVVPAAGRPVDPVALRAYAAAALPDYAVPERFVAVDRIPLTANGKVDTRTLRRRFDPETVRA